MHYTITPHHYIKQRSAFLPDMTFVRKFDLKYRDNQIVPSPSKHARNGTLRYAIEILDFGS
jgi:hypothetical protein